MERAEIADEKKKIVLQCFFNPKEYTLSKQNKWEEKPAKGKNVAHMEFGGGQTGSIKLQLLFDTFEAHERGSVKLNRAGQDVRDFTRKLWKMMDVEKDTVNPATGKGEPPRVRFRWGNSWTFLAVIESISEKFILFDDRGTPLRSVVDISFREVKDEKDHARQNPTSGGGPGDRLRTVREGDTLPGISYEMYGDATLWRRIAEANAIDDPRRLVPGSVLIVRALPALE